MSIPTELFTWEMLGTLAGAVAAVFLLVQLTKQVVPLWIPVRIYAWLLAWGILTLAAFVLGSFSWPIVLLNLFNGAVVALTAMGGYEVLSSAGFAKPRTD